MRPSNSSAGGPDSTVAETLQGYDAWSSSYDALENSLILMVERVLDLHPEAVRGKRVLELGCGTARLARRFLGQGAAAYTGVDGSAGMLGRAMEQYKGDARVRFIQADIAGELPVEARGFDVVVTSLVLEHFVEIGGVLRNVARFVSPGGVVRMLDLHADRQRAGTNAHFLHEGRDVRLPSYPHDGAELRRELEKVGLTKVGVAEHTPDEAMVARFARLAKYAGMPLLIDVRARAGMGE